MKNKTLTSVLLGMLGIGVLFIVACIAVGLWFFSSVVDRQGATESAASQRFSEIRARFGGAAPAFMLQSTGVVSMRAPGNASRQAVHTFHVMQWQPDEQKLTRIDLPFSLLRLKGGRFSAQRIAFTVEDVERYGSTILVDQSIGDGEQVLVWTD
jgi:hypothetical protein